MRLPANRKRRRYLPLALGAALLAGGAVVAVALIADGDDPGDLDPGFGDEGVLTTELDFPARVLDLDIRSDRSIVAAGARDTGFGPESGGAGNEVAIARYRPDGGPDPEFGSGGTLSADAGFRVNAVAIDRDGAIVAAGGTEPGRPGGRFGLARYDSDGAPDPSFADDGRVATDFGLRAEALAVAIAADGRIVAAGLVHDDAGGDRADEHLALARYEPDGSPDRGFGDRGTVVTRLDGDAAARAVAIDADGAIVVAGSSADRPVLVRYSPDGSLDRAFADDGTLSIEEPRFSFVNAIALDAEGRILVAGRDFILARYGPDGSPDLGFAEGGVSSGGFASAANALALSREGEVVVAGDLGSRSFALARYQPDGSLDRELGEVTTEVAAETRALAVAIDGEGRIVVGGTADGDFALARYRGAS